MTLNGYMSDDLTPILVGAGQFTQRDVEPDQALEPVDMMAEASRRAAMDAGTTPRSNILESVDSVSVVNILGWNYRNAPGLLSARLGISPRETIYSTVGGNTPQWFVNETADRIASGKVRVALLAGAEALYSYHRARKAGVWLDWSKGGDGDPTVAGEDRMGSTAEEMSHGLQMPIQIYPLFENALRAHRGLSINEHRRYLGSLCSSLSSVVSNNPYAWFRDPRTEECLTVVSEDNRYIAFPYTKYMNAIITVDQSAALIMTSVSAARALGIHPERWVFLHGSGDAHDLWYVTQRQNYYSAPALRLAGEKALTMARISIDEVDYLDLYSCFPCAVQIGRSMLGISEEDSRPLTVTGGLACHGGPGNNYTMHAIATMTSKLRSDPGSKGLVTGMGWYLTKHSVGVYSSEPPARAWRRERPENYQPLIDRSKHPVFESRPDGRADVETYTVLFNREGRPEKGIVIGRLADHSRFVANTPDDEELLREFVDAEAVGRRGRVTPGPDGVNQFTPQ
ncbi:MAG: acetyl-CoA acetyltransferase [Candidatus Binatia bacterium]